MSIKYYNRSKKCIETEKVYGDGGVKWLYQSVSGKILSNILKGKLFSKIYGETQSLSISRFKVPGFIKNFDINMDEYLPAEGRSVENPYGSFNEFFIRKFKKGKRDFNPSPNILPAFSEARYFAYDSISGDEKVPVKGTYMLAKDLLGKDKWSDTFKDGPLTIARLCPVDYHRFHYPVDGKLLDHYPLTGELHSVNPTALKEHPSIFIKNERHVSIFETKEFGKLAYIEVGAICVGKIVQSNLKEEFKRGEEKGYFLFGGSTVILLGEKNKFKFFDDITAKTNDGIETYLKLGEELGQKL